MITLSCNKPSIRILIASASIGLFACEAPKQTSGISTQAAQTASSSDNSNGCHVTPVLGGAQVTCGANTVAIQNGSAGSTGPAGSSGPAGPQGPTGPRGMMGPPGSGAGHEFWLVQLDGTPIAQLVDFGFVRFTLWDETNSVAIPYSANGVPNAWQAVGVSSFYLYYSTPDCSGPAYSSGSSVENYGVIPGTAFALGGNLYKVNDTFSSPVIVALKQETPAGVLSACTPYTPGSGETGSRPSVTQITPSFPLSLNKGEVKIVRQ